MDAHDARPTSGRPNPRRAATRIAGVLLAGLALALVGARTPATASPLAETEPRTSERAAPPDTSGSTLIWEHRVGDGRDTITLAPGQRRACVTRTPVFLGTFSVRSPDGELLPGVDYVPDERSGCIELRVAPSDTLRLEIRYRYLPLSSSLHARLHEPVSADGRDVPIGADVTPIDDADDGARLVVGGSKTFAVEVASNGDAALRQSLDLSIRGRLSPEVSIQAVLSDRDSPVTPEGTSSELEELDKVLVQLETRNARATFGDIEVSQTDGQFARYERRLEGAEVERTGERTDVLGVVANARGEFRSVEFFGIEGRQGPYRIGDLAGGTIVTIVPGSEEVVLDGERLSRGESRDYVIDYELGELTFMPRRAVTFDSRITVDFEVETESYRRGFAAGRAGYRSGDVFSIRAFAASETDDRDAPRGFTLDDDEKDLLASLGDEEPIGEAFAVREVAVGEGDYVEVAADAEAPRHFQWVGFEQNGNLLVSFVRVGDGLGAYVDSTLADGSVAYLFRGEGVGDFEPGRRLDSPRSHDLVDLELGWTLPRLTLSSELAASRVDENTFSARDDGDNDGLAGRAEMVLHGPTWADDAGGVRLRGKWRSISRDFEAFSRINDSFDYLDWNYDPTGLTDGDDRASAAIEVDAGDGSALSVEAARLRSGRAFDAERVSASVRRAGRLSGDADVRRTWSRRPEAGTSGRRDVARASTRYRWRALRPELRLRHERTDAETDTTSTGSRFVELRALLGVAPTGPLRLDVDVSERRDDTRGAPDRPSRDWARERTTRETGTQLSLTRWSFVGGQLEYRHRRVDATGAAAGGSTDLARLALDAEPWQGAFRARVDYRVTTEAFRPRIKTITPVAPGTGNYDMFGIFVGTGDYDVAITEADEEELLSRLDLAVRASFAGRNEPDASFLMRQVRVTSFVRVDQTTDLPFSRLINPLSGDLYATGPNSATSASTMRHELTFLPAERFSPRGRWERYRSFDGRFENVAEWREQDVVTAGVRAVPRERWSFGLDGVYERNADVVTVSDSTSSATSEEVFDTTRLEGESVYQPTSLWRVSLGASWGGTESPGRDGRETRVTLTPTVNVTPSRWGRIQLSVTWVEVRDRLDRVYPTFAFGLANASGVEWSAVADVRLREYLTLAGTLRAARPRGASTRYDGRMELRAYF